MNKIISEKTGEDMKHMYVETLTSRNESYI